MNRKGILSLLFLIGAAVGHTQKIYPANPDLAAENFRMDSLPESEINIPIQVHLKPLFQMAEKSVDSLFTSPHYPDEWVQEGCDIRYKYSFRRGPLQFSGTGNTLTLGFTGYYKITGSTRLCINGTVVSPWTPACRCGFDEPERRVQVSFTSAFAVQPDYKVRLYVKRNEPRPMDKCEVCFWGQDITGQVMKGLITELDLSKKEIEKTYGTVDLKSRFQQVWDQLNKVYNLYNLGWLQINPRQFRINTVFINRDTLSINLGLSAQPVVQLEKPIEKSSWVPALGSPGKKPGFRIFLDAMLSYDSLSLIMNQNLAGKQFDFKKGFVKKKFIIDSCRVYGGGHEKLVIKVHFSGTNQGIFFLTGKPAYDLEKRLLHVLDIDFDIKSKNILLGSADWLFDKKITREISKYSQFELGATINNAKNSLNKELNRELTRGIRSQGSISEISLAAIYPMQQYLVIRSNCTGTLSVKVESAEFSY